MRLWSELSLTAQTAYAQLLDAALAAEHVRGVADLSGSFSAKSVKGHTYWYYQYTEPSGDLRQIFVGPDSPAVRSLRESKSLPAATASLVPLVRSAAALGCAGIHRRHYRVLKRLSEYGFFAAGGLLIGTHAFIAYANMLGVKWGSDDTALTQDIDFAHPGKRVELALMPGMTVQLREAIESLEMGFLPIRGLSGKSVGSYLLPSEPEFRLDFLTCATRRGEVPYEHPELNITLQPLKFMEFSLQKVSQAVLLSTNGALVVNLPDPARYALHKLIVIGEREGSYQTKSNKDARQAGVLIDCLREQRPEDLREAWTDLCGRGRGWLSRAKNGLATVDSRFGDLRLTQWFEEKK
jgi:hypothetical protein